MVSTDPLEPVIRRVILVRGGEPLQASRFPGLCYNRSAYDRAAARAQENLLLRRGCVTAAGGAATDGCSPGGGSRSGSRASPEPSSGSGRPAAAVRSRAEVVGPTPCPGPGGQGPVARRLRQRLRLLLLALPRDQLAVLPLL